MIIVFIDAENAAVTIVNSERESVKTYPWNDLKSIVPRLGSDEVYYVTAAEFVPAENVAELLASLTGEEITEEIRPTGRKFIRSTVPGKLIVHGNSGEPLEFDSPIDFKPLDVLPSNLESEYPSLSIYMNQGKIEIVDECDINDMRSSYQSKMNRFRKNLESNRDEALDKMLVKGSVNDFLDHMDEDEDTSDTIEIGQSDLRGNARESQEFFNTIRQSGIEITDQDIEAVE